MRMFTVPVRISRQEDGLWRAEVPEFQGCFVDGQRLADVLSDIQEAIAMYIDLDREEGRPLPPGIAERHDLPVALSLPVIVEEHAFKRVAKARKAKVPA